MIATIHDTFVWRFSCGYTHEAPKQLASKTKHLDQYQARSHWLGWSGFNLTTFTQFIQLSFYKLISSVALQTSFVKTLLYSNIFR